MFRFLCTFLGMVFLAIAAIYGVVDTARSIADSSLILTSLSETAAVVSPEAMSELTIEVEQNDTGFLTSEHLATVLSLPTSITALVFSLLFYLLGYKPERKRGRFTLE